MLKRQDFTVHIFIFLVAISLVLSSCSQNSSEGPSAPSATPILAHPRTSWETWRAEENAAWSSEKFAILKIDDAIYLNAGQSAVLASKKQKVLQHVWKLNPATDDKRLKVTYVPPMAKVVLNGSTQVFTLEKTQTMAISEGIDLRLQLTQVEPGKNGLRVMIYNQAHPAAKEFRGLDHFAFDPAAIVEADVIALTSPEPIDFQTSRGWFKRFYKLGSAHFTYRGQAASLPLYADGDDAAKVTSVSLFFTDTMAGKETYGVGRYLDIDVNGLPTRLTIDFNRAYNPNCARSDHFNCPLATDRLAFGLEAGERSPKRAKN